MLETKRRHCQPTIDRRVLNSLFSLLLLVLFGSSLEYVLPLFSSAEFHQLYNMELTVPWPPFSSPSSHYLLLTTDAGTLASPWPRRATDLFIAAASAAGASRRERVVVARFATNRGVRNFKPQPHPMGLLSKVNNIADLLTIRFFIAFS